MHYMGGKARVAKELAEIINKHMKFVGGGGGYFVSLFCGACSVEAKVNADVKICNDKHKYLVAMLKAVQNGYILPDTVSREEYNYIRSHLDDDPALSGFVGFACSYGGKWFDSYARCARERNYALEGKNSLLRKMDGLRNAEFICGDYRDVPLPDGCVIYADPPYEGTTGYTTGKFDSQAFWEYARKISENHIVLISEENAPEDFVPVWEKQQRRTLAMDNKRAKVVTERLYIHRNNANLIP